MKWRIPADLLVELTVSSEMRDADYHELLDVFSARCARFSLTWRSESKPSKRLAEFAKQLAPYLIEEEPVLEWPGTMICSRVPLDDRPVFRIYSSDPIAIGVLKRTRPSLFHWLGPNFPEDPCFYLDNGDCCLVSVSHERSAAVFIPRGADDLLAALDGLIVKCMLGAKP